MAKIDTAWFHQQLDERGESVRGLARSMGLDPSAVSRMLKGERKMSADEQDHVSNFLGVNLEEVAARRRGDHGGFGESKQAGYAVDGKPLAPELPAKMFTEDDVIYKDGKRYMETKEGELLEIHPVWGCMEGTVTVMPGVDLTAPMDWDEEWGEKLYNE
ncbi:MAG: helix-turn-helix domain-containing protein [Rhizobium sp.]|nr:helix-turn-helix domain-containing protein [Rhizobium sp.]